MSELNESNYKRIALINWILTVPMMVLFAWPYFYAGKLVSISDLFLYPAAFIFALPFMITILHGHVTMALGSAHRHHYYNWLAENSFTFGFFFHSMFIKTRFRMTLLILSLILLVFAYFFDF